MSKKKLNPGDPEDLAEELTAAEDTESVPADLPRDSAEESLGGMVPDVSASEEDPSSPDTPEGDFYAALEGSPLFTPPDHAETPLAHDAVPTQILSLDIRPLEQSSTPDTIEPAGFGEEEDPGALLDAGLGAPQEQEQAEAAPARSRTDRQEFYDLKFNELDRNLTTDERQEWNSIYASYRGRSAITGTIIGVDRHTVQVWNKQTDTMETQEMYCCIVVPYRVRIVIPAAEMWETEGERPNFVLQNMVGASIDFIIIKVDRVGGFAIASRRMAARGRRFYLSRRPALQEVGAKTKCRILAVGPRRCLVECFGHDINLTQRELRYTAIPDLRDEYHPGQELECIVKSYDAEKDSLKISVKETAANPFDGAVDRHPVGSRRQAVISGKYGGGVFCNLPDGTVCMCSYSYQYEDSAFAIGDSAIVVIQRYDMAKKQIYGKIIAKW